MAGGRKPGPQCSYNDRVNVDDGTLCLAPSPMAGALGTTEEPTNSSRQACVSAAFDRAVQLAPAAINREIGQASGATQEGLIRSLVGALKVLTAVPVTAPGASVIGSKDIVKSLGLEFLSEFIERSLGQTSCFLQMGISMAIDASERSEADRNSKIERAAAQLAAAVGVLSRAIMQGIVAYLLNKGSRATTPAPASVRTNETNLTGDEAVAQLTRQLRSSKLDGSLATWVDQNWKDLTTDPQWRPRPKRGAGGGVSSADTVISKPARVAPPPVQPESEPSTLTPDADLVAQARTLVAASVQGTPLCAVCSRT